MAFWYSVVKWPREGNGNPLWYSCLENPMDGGAWTAAVHGVVKSRTRLHFHVSLSCIGEGNGNPLQCSCLEDPRGGGAWWAAICGVTQSQTRLKRLSSSSEMAGLQKALLLPRSLVEKHLWNCLSCDLKLAAFFTKHHSYLKEWLTDQQGYWYFLKKERREAFSSRKTTGIICCRCFRVEIRVWETYIHYCVFDSFSVLMWFFDNVVLW